MSPDEKKNRPRPFQNSLNALAQMAQYQAGAEGYAFFRRNPETAALVRGDADGVVIGEESVVARHANLDVYPIDDKGSIFALVFSGANRLRPERILKTIGAVWEAAQNAGQYSQLANELAELETRLLDSKIADRVRGVFSNPETGAAEAIARHVEGVLRPPPARKLLEQLSHDLEQEVEERRLTKRAKSILQSLHGMSEEQAHAHLRKTSRQSRRPLRDIAVDVIDRHTAVS